MWAGPETEHWAAGSQNTRTDSRHIVIRFGFSFESCLLLRFALHVLLVRCPRCWPSLVSSEIIIRDQNQRKLLTRLCRLSPCPSYSLWHKIIKSSAQHNLAMNNRTQWWIRPQSQPRTQIPLLITLDTSFTGQRGEKAPGGQEVA